MLTYDTAKRISGECTGPVHTLSPTKHSCFYSETHDAPPLLRRLRVELGRSPFALPPHPCPTLFACPPSRLLSSSARLCITTAPSHTNSCPRPHLLQLALQIQIHPPTRTLPCIAPLVFHTWFPAPSRPARLRRFAAACTFVLRVLCLVILVMALVWLSTSTVVPGRA